MRRTMLGVATGLLLTGCGASPVVGNAAPSAPPTTAAPALSPDDRFLAALDAAGYPASMYSRAGLADVESLGHTICAALGRGIPPDQVETAMTQYPGQQGVAIVRAAHTAYCASYPVPGLD